VIEGINSNNPFFPGRKQRKPRGKELGVAERAGLHILTLGKNGKLFFRYILAMHWLTVMIFVPEKCAAVSI
jgi:hypothetical protein